MRVPKDVDLSSVVGRGVDFADVFLSERVSSWDIADDLKSMLAVELGMFFDILQEVGAEFGYRVAKEVSRFIFHYMKFEPSDNSFYNGLDAQVNQKLLPKIHGAERVLKPILWGLGVLCREQRRWADDESGNKLLENRDAIVSAAREAMLFNVDNPLTASTPSPTLPISFDKCRRMNDRLLRNGFTSYAEA